MRKWGPIHLITALVVSFCFVLSLWAEEKKEKEVEETRPGDVYTVKPGDTLWDISSKYLKDPYLWPKLWQQNPYITNPHWIYPGNEIRLSPFEEPRKVEEIRPREEPKEVAVEQRPKEEKIEEREPKPEAVEAEAKKTEPAPVEKRAEVVAEARPPEPKPPEKRREFFRETGSAGFLSGTDLHGIGVILDSKEGKNMMSAGDIVYLAFKTSKQVLIGDKYTIFRAMDEVRHPVTNKKIGMRYNIVGNLQVIDQYSNFFTAKIIESFDAIFKGDRIQPYMKEKTEVESKQ
ncbi:MAG: LysM peptidoglycan-binding domain-containing protein [Syntrophaceae bacterium]|nr:LysM peptidoglycan-binding domain-containing protein [Syntrophaceae bacterium]